MKISKLFKLQKTQWELDFVDIDPDYDLPLFLDPGFIANRNGEWAENAHATIHSFFSYVISLIQGGKINQATQLFLHMSEPNETCLGVSIGKPRGHGVGREKATDILDQIIKSNAIQTGLVKDLEDCLIFVEDFGPDGLSDMTTNIIRKHLIEYTQEQCELWGMPLQTGVPSGHYWDGTTNSWRIEHTSMLVIEDKTIILVPKDVTSFCKLYTSARFHRHAVLVYLQDDNFQKNTSLVRIIRDRKGRVTSTKPPYKTTLIEEGADASKEFLRTFTLKHPFIFQKFKKTFTSPNEGLSNNAILDAGEKVGLETEPVIAEICQHLITSLAAIPSGTKTATDYHRLMFGILDLLLYQQLTHPKMEDPINDGRKRVDISFQNSAASGLFFDLARPPHDIPCRFVWAECKNYTDDIGNTELDQLAMRLSTLRGKIGLLLCREIDNPTLLRKRCSDAWLHEQKLLLCITDEEVTDTLSKFSTGDQKSFEKLLREKYRAIVTC